MRDAFFAVQRQWIERDPEVGVLFETPELLARQKLRIDGLVHQHRVHQLANPLIEDLDFIAFEEGSAAGEATVTALLEVSLVETILDADSGALVAGHPNVKQQRKEPRRSRGATATGVCPRSSSPARARATSRPRGSGPTTPSSRPRVSCASATRAVRSRSRSSSAEMGDPLGREPRDQAGGLGRGKGHG